QTTRIPGRGLFQSDVPLRDCPKSSRAGNCANCDMRGHGGSAEYNRFGRRELRPPVVIKYNGRGEQLTFPARPVVVKVGKNGLRIEAPNQVGRPTWASRVVGYNEIVVGNDEWRTARLEYFRREKDGPHAHPPETHEEILEAMLTLAWNAVV